jgi:hypothetical protein
MELNESNYYSLEADREFMSYSQYKNFLSCEAAAVARLDGWKEPKSTALLVGSYVHAAIEGDKAIEKFKSDNPEIFTQKGDLKAEFGQANLMIDTIRNDRLMQISLEGQKEVILTGEFGRVIWKCKLDNLNREKGFFSDLKTCQSLSEKVWDNEKRAYVSFIEAYGYIGQMALYQEISRQIGELDPFMAIVTKENPPDKLVISFSPELLEDEFDKIKDNLPRVMDVKCGKLEPLSCGKCAYCRESKKLSRVYDFNEIYDLYWN